MSVAFPLVKICGIREPKHAIVAAEAGADMIGVVFYPPSSRYVATDEARAVVEAIDGSGVRIVGLFVDEPAERINRIAEEVGLDLIQLSGDEPVELYDEIERPVIPSVRVDSSGRLNEEGRFQTITNATSAPWAVMIDAHVPGMYGGTGTVADWFVAADFARRYRVVLAGGLRPDSVSEAIHRVKPFAVDVSSGVETNGVKDETKIRSFVAAARGRSK
jgi:phosphoribosylanthranilate isomerase